MKLKLKKHLVNYLLTLEFVYIPYYAYLLFTFFSCAAYIMVQPVMCFIGLLFFWVSYVVLKYQILYIFSTKHETGGEWFPKVFFLISFSMIGFQLTTLAGTVVLSAASTESARAGGPSVLLFITAISTALYYFWIMTFIAPNSDYVDETILSDEESGSYLTNIPTEDDGNEYDNENYNPAMFKPLKKLWVHDYQIFGSKELYNSEYRSSSMPVSRRKFSLKF
jgi:hypothetical protein